MSRLSILLLIAVGQCLPAHGAERAITAGEAAAIIATQFCGVVVGESLKDIERAGASIPGFKISAPLTRDQLPEPFRTHFSSTLESEPYAIYYTIGFEPMNPTSGSVVGLVKRDGTMCQVATLQAKDTVDKLEAKLKRPDSGWQAVPNGRDATLYRRKASNGRGVGMMFASANGVTPIYTYLMLPEPGSASPESIDEFASDAMHACARVVLGDGKFESPNFRPHAGDLDLSREGAMLIHSRTRIPTGVVGLERKGGQLKCTIVSGDPVDATEAVQAALARAVLSLPDLQVLETPDAAPWRWSLTDPKSGKKARMKIGPMSERISAELEILP